MGGASRRSPRRPPGCCSRQPTSPDGHRPHLTAPGAADRGVGPLRAGCDPGGIDRAAARFCELRGAPGLARRDRSTCRGPRGGRPARCRVPLTVPVGLGGGLLGHRLSTPQEVARLLGADRLRRSPRPTGPTLAVTVPDQPARRPAGPLRASTTWSKRWPAPAATRRIERRPPTWPEPGRLTAHQRERRRRPRGARGLGAPRRGRRPWPTRTTAGAGFGRPGRAGDQPAGPATSRCLPALPCCPGCCGRWPTTPTGARVRSGFSRSAWCSPIPTSTVAGSSSGRGRWGRAARGPRRARDGGVVALGPTTTTPEPPWPSGRVASAALRFEAVAGARRPGPPQPGLHPTRSARLVAGGRDVAIGAVGEVDPDVVAGLRPGPAPGGWLAVDLGLVDETARTPEEARPVSRSPPRTSTSPSSWPTRCRRPRWPPP